MSNQELIDEIDSLIKKIEKCREEYYRSTRPTLSDREYDALFDRLKLIESEHPELVRPDSPAHRVGSDLSQEFPEVEHTIPVLSLDKSYALPEIQAWIEKVRRNAAIELSFVMEEKIDGSTIVLYYEKGLLIRAVTRGNGFIGNDITGNIRTISSIPLKLQKPVTGAVRGEVFLPTTVFETINSGMEVPYANPRNLAAGVLRRIKSSEVAEIPLDTFIYEGYFNFGLENHFEILDQLAELGFKVNENIGFFSNSKDLEPIRARHPHWLVGRIEDVARFIAREKAERVSRHYEIDGLVLKVNELGIRDLLGYTGHHPKWEIAFKFESPLGTTKVRSIDVQIGRTGRATPVARVEPVTISGSKISNATLHNQEYIEALELALDDTVEVSRRGDVIPAVERVLDKNVQGRSTWQMPDKCPSCQSPLERIGAHHFCKNRSCPAQVSGRILFFIGKGGMDIENLGPETADTLLAKGLIKDFQDLYFFDPDKLLGEPGFGEKKINLIKEGIRKSRERPYATVLVSLGITDLGNRAVELILEAGLRDMDTLLKIADRGDAGRLTSIHGIGEKTAANIIRELCDPDMRIRIESLRRAGLHFSAEDEKGVAGEVAGPFKGQIWCVTGSFASFKPRDLALEEVKRYGGKVSSSVTSKTTHLLAGDSPGSKLTKAIELGVIIVNEEQFLELLNS